MNQQKILMATMGLDIGGAETHIVELCKALKEKGIMIYVVSNGGVFERELQEHGILHFHAPMHNRRLLNIIKSYFILKKIIRENDITVVHAHARIPAFLCGLLCKKMKVRFVTTAHFTFDTSLGYKLLTNWGEHTLSVSQDIEEYLIKNYKIEKENISVTINGIDTERFTADVDYSKFAEALGLSPSKKRIVCVTRLEDYSSASPYLLLECAEELFAKTNGELEIIITGGGGELESIRAKADEINKKLGVSFIFVTGPRTDINQVLASADLFVGVSRAALEAMSAERPVVLCGNQGYGGIFSYDLIDRFVETNFCCRTDPKPQKDWLLRDLTTLLDTPDEELSRLGAEGRRAVKENYSIEKMAEDAVAVYENLEKPARKYDVIISGYYGSNNHGDDALLKAITDDLRIACPNIKISVLSSRPAETRKRYGLDAVWKFNFIKIYFMLKKTSLLICGGGSLIQDLTSTRSLIYYLHIIKTAVKARTKVMLYANGVGPVRLEKNRQRTKNILNKVNLITLRDTSSLEILEELGVDKPKITVTADAAFSLNTADNRGVLDILRAVGLADAEEKYFCIAIRKWKYLKDGFERDIAAFADYIYEAYGLRALFVSMQPSVDGEISRRVISLMKTKAAYAESTLALDDLLAVIKGAEFVLAMRLHTVIYAAMTGAPSIGLVYDPKVNGQMETFGQKTYADIKDFDVETLKSFADKIILNREEISQSLRETSAALSEKSFENAKLAVNLLYGRM